MPRLPGEARHVVEEPAETRIFAMLEIHALPGEAQLWREVLAAGRANNRRARKVKNRGQPSGAPEGRIQGK
jgi:hypothetical protein